MKNLCNNYFLRGGLFFFVNSLYLKSIYYICRVIINLKTETMKTIYDFKKGDEIVRIQPAKEYSPARMGLLGEEGGLRDRRYMGEKLIFVGIVNGQIYCQRTDSFSLKMFGDKMLDLALDIWDEGWDLYIDPAKLLEGFEPKVDESTIKEQIKKAIEAEDYELAEKLKGKLNGN